MILNAPQDQYITTHSQQQEGEAVLHWRVAAIVVGLCRSGDRKCGSCDCSDLIKQVGGNTIGTHYTPTKNLPDIRTALEQM